MKKLILSVLFFLSICTLPAYAFHNAVCYDADDQPVMHYTCNFNKYWATPEWIKETSDPGPVSSDGTCASDTGIVWGSPNRIYNECMNVDHGIFIQYLN